MIMSINVQIFKVKLSKYICLAEFKFLKWQLNISSQAVYFFSIQLYQNDIFGASIVNYLHCKNTFAQLLYCITQEQKLKICNEIFLIHNILIYALFSVPIFLFLTVKIFAMNSVCFFWGGGAKQVSEYMYFYSQRYTVSVKGLTQETNRFANIYLKNYP